MIHNQKHIHFIGICGVGMGALAMAMKHAGWKVTGSDVGIYPPISTYLKNQSVEYYTGWHADKIGEPDLVVVGNVAGSENPEWQYVQEKKLPYVSYPELIAKYFIKPNSIVCAGTYGKTTTSALLSWILTQAGMDPSYMFGGLMVNEDFPSAVIASDEAKQSSGVYSVVEGDEYKTARWDNSPKFSHYSPTHLLLTAVEWDHADVYPTEESYFEAFQKLIDSIPKNGLIVASERVKIQNMKHETRIKIYGQNGGADYRYSDVKTTTNGIELKITHKSYVLSLKSYVLGDYMADNICAAFAMAHQIGIESEKIIEAIASFKGLKRRLEKRFDSEITVIDDIAHSPAKAKSTLETLKNIYSGKIIAIFEPNTGNRQIESIPSYDNHFTSADEVIIPRLTLIKQDPTKPEAFDGEKLTEVISKTHNNVKYIDDDEKLIQHILGNTKPGDVVVFLGSHGFRGMIEQLISQLK